MQPEPETKENIPLLSGSDASRNKTDPSAGATKYKTIDEYDVKSFQSSSGVGIGRESQVQIFLEWFHIPEVSIHLEVAARISISCCLTYWFCFVSPPNLLPSAFASMVGFLTPITAMIFPTFIFSIGMMVPVFIVLMVVAMACSSLVLVAASKGDAYYVAVYGLFALSISTLRFHKGTGALTAILIVNVIILTTSTYKTVQGGGLVIVRTFWTSSGLQNPMALMQNFLIANCWVLALASSSSLIPPWRTARRKITKYLFPKVLRDCAIAVRIPLIRSRGKDEKGSELLKQGIGSEAIRGELEHFAYMMEKIAVHTAYEPRLLRCKRPEPSWIVLKDLSSATLRMISSTVAVNALPATIVDHEGALDIHERVAEELELCARALETGTSLEDLSSRSSTYARLSEKFDRELEEGRSFDPGWLLKNGHEVRRTTSAWLAVMDTPGTNPEEVHSLGKGGLHNFVECARPWILPSVGLVVSVAKSIYIVFTPKFWKRGLSRPARDKVWWCFKFAAGFTIILCMLVYWDEFREFEIPTRDNENFPKAHFVTWAICGYAFATTQTVEGTFKKGLIRLFSTCLGAFSAWLVLGIALDESNEYNQLWLVLWMTVTTFLFSFLGLEGRSLAYLGMSADYGYFNIYFVMTQAVVIFQVYLNAGSRNGITLNRIVGNATGIVVAMVLSAIPPTLRGGSPNHVRLMVDAIKSDVEICLRGLLSKDPKGLDACLKQRRSNALALREMAQDLLKDASIFSVCPIYRVDPCLRQLLDHVSVTSSLNYVLFVFAFRMAKDDELWKAFDAGGRLREKVIKTLGQLENKQYGGHSVCDGETKTFQIKSPDEGNGVDGMQGIPLPDLFLHYVDVVMERVKEHDAGLARVKVGFLWKADS